MKADATGLHRWFERQVRRTPDAVALVCATHCLTYRELDRRADRMARHLRARGIGHGSLVALLADRRPELVTAVVGILKAGAAYLPLDPSLPAARLAYMLEDSGAAAVIGRRSLVRRSRLRGPPVIDLEADRRADCSAPDCSTPDCGGAVPPALEVAPESPAYVLYTSGSTGRPKGVRITHGAVANLLGFMSERPGLDARDTWLAVTTLAFDISVVEIFLPLVTGARVVMVRRSVAADGARLRAALAASRATIMQATPATWRLLLASGWRGDRGFKILSGGEAMTVDLASRLMAKGASVWNLYGPTETTIYSTAHHIDRAPGAEMVPIGRPIAETEILILDRLLEPVAAGAMGEICIGGAGLTPGYLERPALTAEKLVPHPLSAALGARLYLTGDSGRRREDGAVEFLGRLDHQVKIRGFRLELGEIEAVLGRQPEVGQAVVVARESAFDESQLVAFVVPRSGDIAAAARAPSRNEHVGQWQSVWEDLYHDGPNGPNGPNGPETGRVLAPADATFDVTGWRSSYDGQPIPSTEMREWVDSATQNVLALRPDRVLEIGCGTGLLLYRIADYCSHFFGTDFSESVLDVLNRDLASSDRELPKVRLMRRSADDFEGIPRGDFDTVIINSVVQYFPGVEYLMKVLRGAVAATATGGSIFVGDVRDLSLQEAFCASLELFDCPSSVPLVELAGRVHHRRLREEELLLDPAFFLALDRHLPRLGQVRIQLKSGRSHNELTRFRYDVILHLDSPPAAAVSVELPWNAGETTLAEVSELLAHRRPHSLGITAVPNPRLVAETRMLEILRSAAGSTVADARAELRTCFGESSSVGIEPDDFRALGEEFGYAVELSRAGLHADGAYDVVFWRSTGDQAPPAIVARSRPAADSGAFANDPLRDRIHRRLARRWRRALERELPPYMVPAAFVLLDALPLTPSGKVDRLALPAAFEGRAAGPFVAPRDPLEELLAGIFGELLEIPRIGIHDDFFALGGHSLLATLLITRARQTFSVELSLRTVLDHPTVERLARRIASLEREEPSGETPPLSPAPRDADLPLSFGQERLWFLHQIAPSSAAYNLPMTLHLRGRLDAGGLERALGEITRRHEVLRTVFNSVDGRPVQAIRPSGGTRLPQADLRALVGKRLRSEARRLAEADAQRAFDLEIDLPLRTTLVRLAEDEHLLLLTFHHIASDGWSDGLFFRELGALYDAFRRGEPSPLEEIAVQYADFAIWQRRWIAGEVLEAQVAYWRRQLEGLPPVPDLPTDRPRPAVLTFAGARRRFRVASDLRAALEAQGKRHGATLFMMLLAAFQALLYRLTGGSSVRSGTPIANRGRPEVEGLIGFFVNTLVLRAELDDDPRAVDLLDRVREVTLGAYAHQDLPFEKLVEELDPHRDPGRTPLFQSMFAMQEPLSEEIRLSGLESRFEMRDNGGAMFDLTLYIGEHRGGLEGVVEYRTDLFDATTIDRLGMHFIRLLEGFVAAPASRISELPLLCAPERHALTVEAADTASPSPAASLHEIFARQAAATPEAVALIRGDLCLTYRELDLRANRLAHHLRQTGVGPESVVGICLERTPAMVEAVLAVLKTGGAYLPLDPSFPPRRLALMLRDSRAPVLITRQSLVSGLFAGAPEDLRLVDLDADREAIEGAPATDPSVPGAAERAAYVIYTSGSSGAPKGVVGLHRGAVNRCRWMWRNHPFAAGEVCCQKTTLTFVDSVWEIFGPLLAGVPSVLVPERAVADSERLATLLAAQRVSRIALVPSLLRLLLETLDDLDRRLPDLSLWVVSGETLSPDLAQRFASSLPRARLLNLYGSSEVAADVTAFEASRWASRAPVPVGRPIANTAIHLVDRRLGCLPLGVPGELVAGGAGLARGYLHRPALTAEKFVPDPWGGRGARLYLTGDRARRLADGQIDLLGRFDAQVKVRGFRVELGEIEAELKRHTAVRQAVVATRPGADGDPRLVAYLVGEAALLGADSLRAFLAQRLPDFMVPSAFLVVDQLPLLVNGKVDRAALPSPRFGAAEEARFVAPRNPTEEILAAIWTEVLGVPRVGIHDNFFSLGGHSLLATRVTSRLRRSLDLEVAPRSLFESPTVAQLAARVERERGQSVRRPPLRRVARDRDLPLSFSQERLWFLDQLEPENPGYNLPEAWDLAGELDVTALAGALAEIVRRHQVLRSFFPAVDGRPTLAVSDHRFKLPVVDLSHLSQRRALSQRLAREQAWRLFDLERPPLLRAVALRLGTGRSSGRQRHVLLLTLHHSVSDGWSRAVLRRELAALYEAFHRRRPSPLAELPVQYVDFAVWQRQWLRGELLDDQLGYWRTQLAGLAPLRLQTDRPRPARKTYRGASRKLAVGEGPTGILKGLGARQGGSLYMTLLAVFLALLHRLTGRRDLAVGSLVANRSHEELEGLIGLFVNSLVLRVDLSGDPRFSHLLRRVRRAALEAYSHQDVPFEKLVAELAPERDLSRNPLFQVVFAMHQAPVSLDLAELGCQPLEVGEDTARFDLGVHLWETGEGGLEGFLVYDTDLFDASTMVRFAGSLTGLLQAVAEDPQRRVSELPLMTRAESHQIGIEWNDSRRSLGRGHGLCQLILARAAASPDATAVAGDAELLTYGELERRSGGLAADLASRGVGPESLVGLHLARSPELVVAILAVWRAGGAFLPLDPGLPGERLGFLIEDAGVALVLTRGATGSLPLAPEHVLVLDAAWEACSPAPGADATAGPQAHSDLAYVFYTSGSTGRPKGVMVPHQGIANRLLWGQEIYPLSPEEAVLQLASPGFDFSLWEILAPLAFGARLVLAPSEEGLDLEELTRFLCRQRVTVAHFVPSLLEAWLASGARDCTSLRRVFCGGETLGSDLCRRFLSSSDAELDNQYGPTEASIDVTYWSSRSAPEHLTRGLAPIGRPIANTEIHLLDARLRPVPLGARGEIGIGGAGLARGYLGRPGSTAEKFVPRPFGGQPGARLYRSGDLGRTLADGSIDFLGRLDHQVKIRGVRVELGEIEQVLREQPSVKSAAVVVRDGEGVLADRRLVAYVVLRPSARPVGLRAALERRLPAVMIPSITVPLDALPRTSQGKVDRAALASAAAPATQSAADVPPRGPIEEILAEIWSRVLGVREVGARDDFFRLGGHSLIATQVVSRIRRALGAELPVRALFEHRTIAELASHLVASSSSEAILSPRVTLEEQSARPLSFAQERLWFLDRLEGPSAVYNMPTALRLDGAFDHRAAVRSLREIVRRHEVLRTTFLSVDGRARQRISPCAPTFLVVVDLRRLTASSRSAEARRLAREEASRPFDLERGPLLRATVVELAAEEHRLLLTLHHIVSDGWSTGVFRRELVTLYRAFSTARPSPLPELAIQYADFAGWQRRWLQGAVLEAQLAYWRRQLAELPELQLPADRPRPAVQTFRGATRTLALSPDLTRALEQLSADSGTSLYMTLLAAFMALLARTTGQLGIAVGSPIANRNREEIEGLIGFFVNTLVLRGDLRDPDRGLGFLDLLKRVRETALDAYAHQDVPFEKLVEELAPERDLSRHPLFQVLFALQNTPRPAFELPGLTLSEIELESRVVRFDQEWHLWLDDGILHGRVIFNTDLFDPSTVERLARSFSNLLRATAAQPRRAIADLPLLPTSERHQLLTEWGSSKAGERSSEAGFLERLSAQVERAPDAVALVFEDQRFSYGELDCRSLRLAGQLRDLGVGPEVPVGLSIERSPAMAIAVLAVLRAGGVYLPLDPAYPRQRLSWMAADSRAAIILADGQSARRLPAHQATIVTVDLCGGAVDLPPPTAGAWAPARAEGLAYLIYTSGSTGRPKGVAMGRGALDRLISWQLRDRRFTGGLRTLQFASLSFDVSFQEMFSTWCSGGTLVLVPEDVRRDGQALLRRIAAARVERLFLPLVALEQLAEVAALAGRVPASLREVVTAGEQLRITATIRRFFTAPVAASGAPSLANQYGPAETHVVTAWPLDGPPRDWPTLPAIGRPIAGSRVHLLDTELRPVPIGSAGQLFIGGASLSRGYRHRPAATAARFVPDPFAGEGGRLYASGDLARHLPDGSVEFLGRLDHQVKIRGFRVEPGEIEAVLESRSEIRRAAVLAVEVPATGGGSAAGDRRLVACVVARRAEAELDLDALLAWLREKLPEYLIPAEVVAVDALPSTPSGKVDRLALGRRITGEAGRRPGGRGDDVTPRDPVVPPDPVEQALAEIFSEVLGREKIGPRDDFFRLGGHSLSSVRLMARIEHRLGFELPLATIFRHRTVEALAGLLRDDRDLPRPSPLVAIDPRGDRPALFFVHPGGGQVLCYRDLSRHLEKEQPFYGLQAPELEAHRGFALDIESMASSYLEAILEQGFEAPYRFGGWSMGGLVAYEMARQARARDLEVELLALIDTAPAGSQPERVGQSDLLAWFARELGLTPERASPAPGGLEEVLEQAFRAGLLSSEVDFAKMRRLYDLFGNNVRAMTRYRPGRFDGKVALFSAAQRPPEESRQTARAWGELAAGVDRVEVPGDHFSLIREPHVRVLATELDRCLNRVDSRALQPI